MNQSLSYAYVYRRSRDRQRKQVQNYHQILRARWGFEAGEEDVTLPQSFTQPECCVGCASYFGRTYGYSPNTRSVLVCAMYPEGWQDSEHCPEWRPCLG